MIGCEVSVFFKREYWNGTILERDVVWNGEKRDYTVLIKNPNIASYLETPYYKDGKLLGYLIYTSSELLQPPKRKESALGCFKNLLVIDPQEDCECEVEVYDSGKSHQRVVWLRNGLPEVVDCNDKINLPMAKTIEFEQIKQCLLTALSFAEPVNSKDDPYHIAFLHPSININETPDNIQKILAPFKSKWNRVRLSEIPMDKIYFSPYQEFLGCFTWNISRYGMFIMPDRLRYCVI